MTPFRVAKYGSRTVRHYGGKRVRNAEDAGRAIASLLLSHSGASRKSEVAGGTRHTEKSEADGTTR